MLLRRLPARTNFSCTTENRVYRAGMDWQQVIALGIVAFTAGMFAWGKFRRRKPGFGKDSHCGCSGGGRSGEQSSIVFHARKGGRPEVIVKMK
jgi:hypothetical protein